MLLRSPPRRLHLLRPRHLRSLSDAAAAVPSFTWTRPPMPTEWTEVPISSIRLAAWHGSLFRVSVDLSSHPSLLASHVAAGQFLPFRFPSARYPHYLSMASPPPASAPAGSMPKSFEFLVKRVHGTPTCSAGDLGTVNCSAGDLVSVCSKAIGRGFEVSRIADAREVLLFAYGTGISSVRSLIESGFCENENVDATLFYGALSSDAMAYQEKFNDWESRGIRIIPVFAREGGRKWEGQRGYVLNAYRRTKKVVNPSSTGAVLCGRKKMYEEVTKALVADGISEDRILTANWMLPEHVSDPSGCCTLPNGI